MAAIILVAVTTAWAVERTLPGAWSWRRVAGTTVLVLAGGFVFALIASAGTP